MKNKVVADPEFLLEIKLGPKTAPFPHPTPLRFQTTIP
jgi:hypothetical protein